MSFYCLTSRSSQTSAASEFEVLLSRHGFRRTFVRQIADRTLTVFDNPSHPVCSFWEGPGEDFALAIGPFIYGGSSGAAALAQYHANFEPFRCQWRDTQGHYSLILGKGERVYLLCDALSAHKIYTTADRESLSNSFLAALMASKERKFDRFGCYHYAWAGGCFAGRTFVKSVRTLSANSVVSLHGAKIKVDPRPSPILDGLDREGGAFAANVAQNAEAVCEVVARWAKTASGGVRLSFSGGFDSRLLLAALMAAGVRPELYTYGRPGDADVEIARQVARFTGLSLDHVDKSAFVPPAADHFADTLEHSMVMFDGWKNDGLIDCGGDVADRVARHASGALPMNGGLGEIFRNFHNLRPGRYRSSDVVDSFYSQYHPNWTTSAFDLRQYRETLAHGMRDQLGIAFRSLTAQEAQLIYPLFRGRFWTAREAEINQHFGPMAFPFLEHSVIRVAAMTPLTQKDDGRLQAAMIARIDPALAALPSGYGFAFDQKPSRAFRLDALLSRHKPMWLRRRTYRHKHYGAVSHPPELQEPLLGQVMDIGYPLMSSLFRVPSIRDSNVLNRVATLEYLGQRFGIGAPR